MKRNFNDLLSFITIAREGSFTRAAAQLGITQPALSQAISGLENRMQIRLLTRTTRSVSLTDAGECLLAAIGDRFDEIEFELDRLTELRDKPAGKVKITCGPFILHSLLLPKLLPILKQYPDIELEFDANHGFKNIVADRYDAGVRLGGTIDKDMIAISLGPKLKMAVVASPDYLATRNLPLSPKELVHHNCINMRMMTSGDVYVWEFEGEEGPCKVRVNGQLTFNTSAHIVDAALAGGGIAFLPEEEFGQHITDGRLIRLLEEWCPEFPGYSLYYPSRKQASPAFKIILDALKQNYD